MGKDGAALVKPIPQATKDVAQEIRTWELIAKGCAATALAALFAVMLLNPTGFVRELPYPISALSGGVGALGLIAWTLGLHLAEKRVAILDPAPRDRNAISNNERKMTVISLIRASLVFAPMLVIIIFRIPVSLLIFFAASFLPSGAFFLATRPLMRQYANKIKAASLPADDPYPPPYHLGHYMNLSLLQTAHIFFHAFRIFLFIPLYFFLRHPERITKAPFLATVVIAVPVIFFFATRKLARKMKNTIDLWSIPRLAAPSNETEETFTLPDSRRVAVRYKKKRPSAPATQTIRQTILNIDPGETEAMIRKILNDECKAIEITIVKVKILAIKDKGVYIGE